MYGLRVHLYTLIKVTYIPITYKISSSAVGHFSNRCGTVFYSYIVFPRQMKDI